MDDTAQGPINQTQSVQPKTEALTDDIQKTSSQTQAIPVGRAQKETGPVIIPEPIIIRSDSEQEPNLHPEVKKAGVEAVSQIPELPKGVQDLGLRPSPESVKPTTEPTGVVKLPLTEDRAEEVISSQKHDSAIAEHTEGIYRTNSIYGLAILVKKIIKEMHGRLIGSK